MSDQPKIKEGKWAHNQRVSHDNLRKGLEVLKIGVEEAVKETESQLNEYRRTLESMTKARRVRK